MKQWLNQQERKDIEMMLRAGKKPEDISKETGVYIAEIIGVKIENEIRINQSETLPEKRFTFPGTPLHEWLEKAAATYESNFTNLLHLNTGFQFIKKHYKEMEKLYKSQLFPYNAVLKIVQDKYA